MLCDRGAHAVSLLEAVFGNVGTVMVLCSEYGLLSVIRLAENASGVILELNDEVLEEFQQRPSRAPDSY